MVDTKTIAQSYQFQRHLLQLLCLLMERACGGVFSLSTSVNLPVHCSLNNPDNEISVYVHIHIILRTSIKHVHTHVCLE